MDKRSRDQSIILCVLTYLSLQDNIIILHSFITDIIPIAKQNIHTDVNVTTQVDAFCKEIINVQKVESIMQLKDNKLNQHLKKGKLYKLNMPI